MNEPDYALIQVKETFTSTYIIALDKKRFDDVIDSFENGTHQEIPTTTVLEKSDIQQIRVIDHDTAFALSGVDYKDMIGYFNSTK